VATDIAVYNAFTEKPFEGNPAGVVTDASGLDERVMQRIARQLNLSETAFLIDPSDSGADVRLRWFTPTQEVQLCGHATIAAFVAAAERGLFEPSAAGERTLRVETGSGMLRIRVARRAGRPHVFMQIPVPELDSLEVDRSEFAGWWDVEPELLDGGPWLRNQIDYWFVPVRDLAGLRRLRLDTDRLARELEDEDAAFTFYTSETEEAGSDWHLRFFAPFHGVPEDPVTGSAQGPMGAIHLQHRVEDGADGAFEFVGEQGDHMRRAGRVAVRVWRERGAIQDLEIAGTAVKMLEGAISVT
jgi:PhzF family phenazine biosynthesis protein